MAVQLGAAVFTGRVWLTGPSPSPVEWARWALLATLAIGYTDATQRIERLRGYLAAGSVPGSTTGSIWLLSAALAVTPALTALLGIVLTVHAAVRTVHRDSCHTRRTLYDGAAGTLATLAAAAVSSASSTRAQLWSMSWSAWTPLGVLCVALAYTLVDAGLAVACGYMTIRPASISMLLPSRDDLVVECCALVLSVFAAVTLTRTPWLTPALTVVLAQLQRSTLVTTMSEAATRDGKTGLLNAAAWNQRVSIELGRAERDRTSAALLLIDLDHFKRVNDTHGHLAGDEVLGAVAAVLTAELRGHDLAARYGGEEFAVYLPAIDLADVTAVAERIRTRIADVCDAYALTASIGIAHYPQHGTTVADLFAAADTALYEAKRAGRNTVSISSQRQSRQPTCAGSCGPRAGNAHSVSRLRTWPPRIE
jgi:diguanylate cyclase (GGDEF)-like protein